MWIYSKGPTDEQVGIFIGAKGDGAFIGKCFGGNKLTWFSIK